MCFVTGIWKVQNYQCILSKATKKLSIALMELGGWVLEKELQRLSLEAEMVSKNGKKSCAIMSSYDKT